MTQEEKQLLLVDLCARLPYGVMVETYWEFKNKKEKTFPRTILTHRMLGYYIGEEKWNYNTHFLPFLRPMSSMTDDEKKEYDSKRKHICDEYNRYCFDTIESIDWLNSHHFDYRGLIEKGLALPVTKEEENEEISTI